MGVDGFDIGLSNITNSISFNCDDNVLVLFKIDPQCLTSLSSRSGFIYSSGYPKGYQKSSTSCVHKITTAENRETRLTFMDLDLNYYGSYTTCSSSDDYVEVRGSDLSSATFSSSSYISRKLCVTTSIKTFTTRKKYIFIYFRRQLGSLTTGRRGFTMSYISYDVSLPTTFPPTTLLPTTLPPTTQSPTTLPPTTLASTATPTDASTTNEAPTTTTTDAFIGPTTDVSTTTVDGSPNAAGSRKLGNDGTVNMTTVLVPVVLGVLLIVAIIAIYIYRSKRAPLIVLRESQLAKENPYSKSPAHSKGFSECVVPPAVPGRPKDLTERKLSRILGSENSAFEETPPTKTPDIVRKARAKSQLSSDSSMKPIGSNPGGVCGNSGLSKMNISEDNAGTEKIGAPRIADKVEDGDKAEGNTRRESIEMTRLEAARKDSHHSDEIDEEEEDYLDLTTVEAQVGEIISNQLYEDIEQYQDVKDPTAQKKGISCMANDRVLRSRANTNPCSLSVDPASAIASCPRSPTNRRLSLQPPSSQLAGDRRGSLPVAMQPSPIFGNNPVTSRWQGTHSTDFAARERMRARGEVIKEQTIVEEAEMPQQCDRGCCINAHHAAFPNTQHQPQIHHHVANNNNSNTHVVFSDAQPMMLSSAGPVPHVPYVVHMSPTSHPVSVPFQSTMMAQAFVPTSVPNPNAMASYPSGPIVAFMPPEQDSTESQHSKVHKINNAINIPRSADANFGKSDGNGEASKVPGQAPPDDDAPLKSDEESVRADKDTAPSDKEAPHFGKEAFHSGKEASNSDKEAAHSSDCFIPIESAEINAEEC
eukprot:gene10761-11911_t